MSLPTFYETVTEAVRDFAQNGYDSDRRLDYWMTEIRRAAQRDMVPPADLERQLRASLGSIYERLVEREAMLKQHPGIPRFTLARVKPRLRDELDRRIMAGVRLIKLAPEEAVTQTLRRFAGWATSIPVGGSDVVARNPVKSDIRKALVRTPFEIRGVNTDQGHKLVAGLNSILALDGGAIAARWETHHTRYPRKEHAKLNGKVFTIRGNWALEAGLMIAGPAGYTDEIEQPAELPSCRCAYVYYRHLRQLPAEMLTAKGKDEMQRVREQMRAA